MNKNNFANNLGEIYRDITHIEIKSTDSFESMMNKFYDVMRKWGICQGTWDEDKSGILINNPEWNMCFQVFREYKILSFDIWLTLSNPPDDLKVYEK